VISEFIVSPGLPAVSFILDEAALPSARREQRTRQGTVGFVPNCTPQQFSRRSLPQTHFNKEKTK
jgi:hypothetical protein